MLDFEKIKYIQVRIGWRFGKYKTGVLFDGFLKNFIITEWDNGALNAELLQVKPAKLKGFFVAVVSDNNMVARLNQSKNRRSYCAHPGGKNNTVFGTFEVGKTPFGDLCSRIAISAVLKVLFSLLGVIFNVLAVFKRKR